jgi:hypothetical protein
MRDGRQSVEIAFRTGVRSPRVHRFEAKGCLEHLTKFAYTKGTKYHGSGCLAHASYLLGSEGVAAVIIINQD